MDRTRILPFSSIVAFVALSSLSNTDLGLLNVIPTAFAQQHKFIANLTGQDEVPAKNTKATGTFEIELTADGRISNYSVNVSKISNVTLVQLQQGQKGTNGPIVATLYKSANPRGQITGSLSKGKVFSNQFEGPLAGKYISDLITRIIQGEVYVNVLTKQNPQGEIRGQLLSATS